jgi:hypothetical protein
VLEPRLSPGPQGRPLRPQEKPLRTISPGRTAFVRVVVGELGLTPSEGVDRVDVFTGDVAVYHVGDSLAAGRVGRAVVVPIVSGDLCHFGTFSSPIVVATSSMPTFSTRWLILQGWTSTSRRTKNFRLGRKSVVG